MMVVAMDNFNQIKQDELNVIANLSEDGLMHMLDKLSKKYYKAFMDNDVDKCKSTIAFIHDIVFMFEDDVNYLPQYINSCMLKNANFILKTIYKSDYDLEFYDEVEVESLVGLNSLSSSIRRSLKMKIDKVDKVNLKNLHDMCVVGETVDENMVELVNALYDSFNSKDDDDYDAKRNGIHNNLNGDNVESIVEN